MGATAAMIGLQVGGTALSSYGAYQQGVSQNKYYQYLAKQNEVQAEEVRESGKKEEGLIQEAAAGQVEKLQEDISKVISGQETGLAKGQIALTSVTAEDIARDTFEAGLRDEAAIRYNADITAWQTKEEAKSTALNLERQAEAYRLSGGAAKKAGRLGAFSTLLGGATSIASSFMKK